MSNKRDLIDEFQQELILLDRLALKKFIKKIRKKLSEKEIINEIIFPALKNIGKLWEEGTLALSQVYMSGHICEDFISEFFSSQKQISIDSFKVGIACLEDYHPLGLKIISSYLRSSSIQPIVYKIGITVDELYEKAVEDKIDILLISTLMLPSALRIKDLIKKFNENDINIKIIVGGAPFLFDSTLYKRIGADAMGKNAFDSLRLIEKVKEDGL